MNDRLFIAPCKYIQGSGVLSKLSNYAEKFGERCLIILSKGGAVRLESVIAESIKSTENVSFTVETIGRECSMHEINQLLKVVEQQKPDVIVGIGGGKTLDTAKAVAHFSDLPVVICPTTASSDAPCSALAVIYFEDGSLDQLLWLRQNPNLVLVDTAVIVTASPRLIAAGIGDALATYFEMQACYDSDSENFCHGQITLAAKAIATQCYETLMNDGYKAYIAVKNKCCTRAVENVIEANTLLSGIGFESGGICAAHPINNGIAELKETHSFFHGEKVAFSLICQLVLKNESIELINKIIEFCYKVNLPVTLSDLNLANISRTQLELVADIANSDPCVHYLPLKVDKEGIISAILEADALGELYKQNTK